MALLQLGHCVPHLGSENNIRNLMRIEKQQHPKNRKFIKSIIINTMFSIYNFQTVLDNLDGSNIQIIFPYNTYFNPFIKPRILVKI
jgi:hypothetical protein